MTKLVEKLQDIDYCYEEVTQCPFNHLVTYNILPSDKECCIILLFL